MPDQSTPRSPLHPVNRTHLEALTGDFGIMQHAIGAVPDPAHGYCVDDVARALQVDLLHGRVLGWAAVDESARRSLRFLHAAARGRGGRLRNFRSIDGSWAPGPGSEDSLGRAMLALGETIAAAPDPFIVETATDLWEHALPIAGRPTALRAHALLVLGCVAVLSVREDGPAEAALEDLATRLHTRFRLDWTAAWPWPEPILTYENGILPRALIAAGRVVGSRAMVETGLQTLDWLIEQQTAPGGHLSPIGNGWWPRDGVRSRFDQQPIEATAQLLAAETALAATGDPRYGEAMELAYGWFLGENDTGRQVAHPERGAGSDGLTPSGVNINEGAESTLMWLMAAEHIRALRAASALVPAARPAGIDVPPPELAVAVG